MQLIFHTDNYTDVPKKMSTIKQESLNEKFINTSLIANVCRDITDITSENDECQNQEVAVKVCETNVKVDEHITHTETSQKPIINEKRIHECVKLSEICDKELPENKENGESENRLNIQIEEKDEVQENREIAIKVDTPVEEKIEMDVTYEHKLAESSEYKNNLEIDDKTEQENEEICNLDKYELNNRVLPDPIEKQVEHNTEKHKHNNEINETIAEQVDKTLIDNKIEEPLNSDAIEKQTEVTTEKEDKFIKQNQGYIKTSLTIEEHDEFKIQDKVDMSLKEDHKSGKPNENNIEMDEVIEEKNEVNDSVADGEIEIKVKANTEDAIEYQVVGTNETNKTNEIDDKTEKRNKGKSEIDETIEEHNQNVILFAENKIEKGNKDESEIIETIDEQDKDDILVTEDKIDENSEMDVTFEERDKVNTLVTEDKIEEGNKESSEMDVTFEEQDQVNNLVTEDKIEEPNKDKSEMDVTFEDESKVNTLLTEDKTEENFEMDVTFEEEDKMKTLVTEDKIEEGNKESSEMDVTFEEVDRVNTLVTEDKIEAGNENSEMDVTHEEQVKVITNITEDKIEGDLNDGDIEDKLQERQTKKGCVLEEVKDIDIQDKLEEPENSSYIAEEKKTESLIEENREKEIKIGELSKEKNEIRDKIEEHNIDEQIEKDSGKVDKCEEQQNEISAIIEKEEEKESQVKDISKEQDDKNSEIEDIQSLINKTIDIIANHDERSVDDSENNKLENHQQALRVDCEKDTGEKQKEDATNDASHDLGPKTSQSEEISRTIDKQKDESEIMKNLENKAKNNDKNMIVDIEDNKIKTNVAQIDPGEVINIADEKDEDVIDPDISVMEKKPENKTKIDSSEDKAESALDSDAQEIKSTISNEVVLNDKSSPEASVREITVEQSHSNKPATDNVEEKKKLTHISKLSNTLDILSDDDEDLPKEPHKEIPSSADKEYTSINIDDDDDIMLIDEESSPNYVKNKTESLSEPKKEVIQKEESTVDTIIDKKEQNSEILKNKKDTIQTELAATNNTEMKTSEPEPVPTVNETLITKKPIVQPNFLKTSKKNLADMSRDELEEFCILKIVESVVDRSNLSEIKSQLKAMANNLEEYQKKASILSKQNRDLQLVLKSIQEEQRKKSDNMPITPLKITRSVGMQVLMTDKVSVRKKLQNPNTAKTNAAANSGPNRQAKAPQNKTKLQKVLSSPNNNSSSPIPVPRLVPALSNSNLNNMKILSPNTNAPVKSQVASPVNNAPAQIVNVPQATLKSEPTVKPEPAVKSEKRPHSRMQQSNSDTVDLTDDEPPTKVIARNATPPVRLVPPQNLLAPHRQPFGQNVSSPRKVYIPISGSQTPVGVRPGQTIMLKTIAPQGPRQRLPTSGVAKPNQSPNTIRMQRLASRHPAPLPDPAKQYQPQNWKALPPAPELKLSKVDNGIVISWKIDGFQEQNHEDIVSYQLYAYQETTSPPSTTLWKKIGDVKALPLPMACTLTQFMAGYKYYFAVRAVDVRSRVGPFSMPGSILLLNKM